MRVSKHSTTDVKVRIVFSISLPNTRELNGSKLRMNFSLYVLEVITAFTTKHTETAPHESASQ